MSDNHQPAPGDVLDRAAAAVRGAAVPPPPADLLAATVAAVHNRLALAEAEAVRRRRRRRIMRGISAGGLAACLAVGVGLMWGGPGAAAPVAFGRVLDALDRVSAVSYLDRQFTHNDRSKTEVRYFARGPRVRLEIRGGQTTYVYDYAAGRALVFSKHHRTFDHFTPPPLEGGQTPAEALLAKLRALRGVAVQAAGTERVGGVDAAVFRADDVRGPDGRRGNITLWVDPKTELPVKVALASGERRPDFMRTDSTYEEFDWHPTFADALLSLDPPAGYTQGVEGFVKPEVPRPSPVRTHQVGLTLAAEAMAAAPCMVVTNTQRTRADGPELTVKMYARRTQFRMEFPNPGGKGLPDPKAVPTIEALIFDADSDHSLRLNFGEKTAQFEKRQGLRPATFPDLAAGFRQIKDADGEPAGEEAVNGKPAKVFKLKNADFIGAKGPDLVTTVWLDAATSLPVKVRVTDGTVDLRFDRFEWPATLPDALFSLVPPKGYTVGEFVPPGPATKK